MQPGRDQFASGNFGQALGGTLSSGGTLILRGDLRYTLILPVVLSLVYIGAYEGHRSWGDLYSLLAFGVFAWATMYSSSSSAGR